MEWHLCCFMEPMFWRSMQWWGSDYESGWWNIVQNKEEKFLIQKKHSYATYLKNEGMSSHQTSNWNRKMYGQNAYGEPKKAVVLYGHCGIGHLLSTPTNLRQIKESIFHVLATSQPLNQPFINSSNAQGQIKHGSWHSLFMYELHDSRHLHTLIVHGRPLTLDNVCLIRGCLLILFFKKNAILTWWYSSIFHVNRKKLHHFQ
jgi:hypothetical protein